MKELLSGRNCNPVSPHQNIKYHVIYREETRGEKYGERLEKKEIEKKRRII